MNKYQQALNWFLDNLTDEWFDWKDLKAKGKHTESIQELIDKEKAMKPISEKGVYDIRCSECGNPNLNTRWTYGRYCSGCGQRIDWNDVE